MSHNGIPRTSQSNVIFGLDTPTADSREYADCIFWIKYGVQDIFQVRDISPVYKHVHVPVEHTFLIEEFSLNQWIGANNIVQKLADSCPLWNIQIQCFPANDLS